MFVAVIQSGYFLENHVVLCGSVQQFLRPGVLGQRGLLQLKDLLTLLLLDVLVNSRSLVSFLFALLHLEV
jgi:hypothetical protein